MSHSTESLRSRLLGGGQPTDEKMVEALASRLEEDEAVEYELSSSKSLVHDDGEETRKRGGGDGGTVLAATDRKLVAVVDTETGRETAAMPYTDLKHVEVNSGLLKTKLVWTVWGHGEFTMRVEGGDGPSDVETYVSEASRAWRVVVAALQDARQYISEIETRADHGDLAGMMEARESAIDRVEHAADRTTTAPRSAQEALRNRILALRDELRDTVMAARTTYGRSLLDKAAMLTDRGEYDDAYETLEEARDHLENALTVAIEDGHEMAPEIQSALADLDERQSDLASRPLDRAERARERAQTADDLPTEVEAWETALGHYRDTLDAGWGTEAEFDGDPEAIRFQIGWVVGKVVRTRTELAERLETAGDRCRSGGDTLEAGDRYEDALEHLDAARRLARQHHAGDEEALDAWRDRLQDKRTGVL